MQWAFCVSAVAMALHERLFGDVADLSCVAKFFAGRDFRFNDKEGFWRNCSGTVAYIVLHLLVFFIGQVALSSSPSDENSLLLVENHENFAFGLMALAGLTAGMVGIFPQCRSLCWFVTSGVRRLEWYSSLPVVSILLGVFTFGWLRDHMDVRPLHVHVSDEVFEWRLLLVTHGVYGFVLFATAAACTWFWRERSNGSASATTDKSVICTSILLSLTSLYPFFVETTMDAPMFVCALACYFAMATFLFEDCGDKDIAFSNSPSRCHFSSSTRLGVSMVLVYFDMICTCVLSMATGVGISSFVVCAQGYYSKYYLLVYFSAMFAGARWARFLIQ